MEALIVADLEMPVMDMNGVELLRRVRQEDSDAAVILVTGDMSSEATACLKLGAFKVLAKPVLVDELLLYADRAIERRQLLIERRERLQACGFSSA